MILTVARYDLDKLSDNSYSLDEGLYAIALTTWIIHTHDFLTDINKPKMEKQLHKKFAASRYFSS